MEQKKVGSLICKAGKKGSVNCGSVRCSAGKNMVTGDFILAKNLFPKVNFIPAHLSPGKPELSLINGTITVAGVFSARRRMPILLF